MIALKTILIATDFSEASQEAMVYGRDLARTFGASIHVIHVTENVLARFASDASLAVLPELQTDIDEAARRRLEALVTEEDRRQLSAVAVLRMSPTTAEAIVDYAQEAKADLVVMGTHGRGALAHLLLGSVAERVVRLAPCPVLTVRSPERGFVAPDALLTLATVRA